MDQFSGRVESILLLKKGLSIHFFPNLIHIFIFKQWKQIRTLY